MVGIILAAGKSARMQQNKLLLDYKGMPLIEHVIIAAKKSVLEKILLITHSRDYDALASTYDATVLHNPYYELGQSQSIIQAVNHCKDQDGLLFMVADNPLIKVKTINTMIALFEQTNQIIVPQHQDSFGNPVIFPQRFFTELTKLSGDCGGKHVINNHRGELCVYHATSEVLFDIDTIEDYECLQCRADD
ncbi:MAG: nucleotidyltransferase family protein [Treponemataceae bacterium]